MKVARGIASVIALREPAGSSSSAERSPDKGEVEGSSPSQPTEGD